MRISISYKIPLLFIAVTAVTLLGLFLYLNNNMTAYVEKRIRENLLKDVRVSAYLLEGIDNRVYDSYSLDKIADDIGKNLGLRVTIISLDGTVYGDTDLDDKALFDIENHIGRSEVKQALENRFGTSTRLSNTLEKKMLYMASVFGRQKKQGIIRLAVPLSEVNLISNRLKKILTASLVIAFFFSLLISILIARLIANPVKKLSWTAQSIAHGDFSKKSSIASRDEIGELASSINFMSDQIKSKIDEVVSSRSYLEAVLLSMSEGVIVINAKGNIVLVNKALKELLSITTEAKGKSTMEIVRNIDVQNIIDSVLKKQKAVKSRELLLFEPEEKSLIVHATPIIRDNNTEGAVLVFHDITELRRLEAVRKDFVANVSHELRTPISNIKGYAETLLEGALNDKKNAKEFLEIIYKDSDRLAALINDILDLSKIESGRSVFQFKEEDIKDIIKNALGKFSRAIERKSIKIRTDIPDDKLKVTADANSISQVLHNLIDNAVKYTPDKGEITLSVKDESPFIKVEVSDTGIGIPQEHITRIFERFYRVDKARSKEAGGTGLGLSIVKHIIQSHNGEVSVTSQPGKGSAFSFTLPKA